TVNIFDVNGKILRTLYSNATLGDNTLEFETKDNDGKTFSQGMYYFRIWLDELGVDVAPGGMFAIVR
ncbi:MAG: hypothetical protein JNL32_09300, partial [Candidatus Kapabacteria bacterium]|nr:hypothetical protein [Candidatus Kapabacteria bacterium]